MTYKLRFDPAVHAIYRSLPDEARRDLSASLVDALADPIGNSLPYGVDDGVMRTIGRGQVTAAILVGEATGTITVVQITYAG